jgi:hypothetical protein
MYGLWIVYKLGFKLRHVMILTASASRHRSPLEIPSPSTNAVVWRRSATCSISHTPSPACTSDPGPFVVPHKERRPTFAEHKRDEVQAFVYDEVLHHLGAFDKQEFLTFLRVGELLLNVEAPSGKKKAGKKTIGKKASGKGSGKGNGKDNAEGSGEGTADASVFTRKNFVQAANILAKSMKEKRE